MLWRHKRWHLTVGVLSGSVNFLAIFGIKCFRHRVYTSASGLKKKLGLQMICLAGKLRVKW